jgi:hypothetical protein
MDPWWLSRWFLITTFSNKNRNLILIYNHHFQIFGKKEIVGYKTIGSLMKTT